MQAQTIILIADKDPDGIASETDNISMEFECGFLHAFNDRELQLTLENNDVHILILDFDFSDRLDGFALLESVKNSYPNTAILPIIPAGQPQLMKEMLEKDFFFYIHKPVDLVETAIALKRLHESRSQQPDTTKMSKPSAKSAFHNMIGTGRSMHRLFDMIIKVAEDDFSTVLIRGDSGTGKEMVAKAIHARSKRRKNNFVAVNCAAIPDDLLESELFGYTKGAFTGATSNKPGRIQYADKGTLFLDEIGDMKSSLQAKLLRVLQEKEFEPVGAFKPISVDTRVLAATHCDLEQLVSDGAFREDLYYRLSVIPLNIPPLKERPEDITPLIDLFIETYAVKRGRKKFSFSHRALSALMFYEWRGNIRELENLIQHMSILYSGRRIQLQDLPEKFHGVNIPENHEEQLKRNRVNRELDEVELTGIPLADSHWEKGQIDFKELINDFETQLIVQAMKFTEGNKKEAAKILNLKRTTLLEKIKKKNIAKLWEE
jgi:DNA-binding NtrC family response regulator